MRRPWYRLPMYDIYCDISASRYHRAPPQVLMLMPPVPLPELDPNRYQLASHPLITDVIKMPVHMFSANSNSTFCGKRINVRTWNTERPFGFSNKTAHGFEVTAPLCTLLTMAPYVSEFRLVMAMFEMCGTFSVFKPTPQMEVALEEHEREIRLSGCETWRRMVDAGGRKTSLWERPPLIELHELGRAVRTFGGMRGAKAFAAAAKAVTGSTASPFEVQASMLLGMSRRRGGRGFSIENNVELELDKGSKLISGGSRRYGDIVITSKDGGRQVVVECQGDAFHGSASASILDSDRVTGLQSMGYEVILVTHSQIRDPEKFEVLVRLIERKLGMAHRPMTERGAARERLMRDEIFCDWESL